MNVAFLDFSRALDVTSLAAWGVLALLGFITGSFVKVHNAATGKDEASVLGGVEASLLALLGGAIARVFIWLLLLPLNDLSGGSIVVGHLFFLIPSVVDDFIAIGSSRSVATPEGLLFMATIVGGFAGMMDGIWRTHDWKGLGWLSFPLDMTWGLAGLNYSMLLHLVNFAWGDHATETRKSGHRYRNGFKLKPTYAFTQGSVMSNLSDNPGTSLFKHEMTHIWQNRVFGPFFTLNYIVWMLIWIIPGLIAGAVTRTASGPKVGAGKGIERLSYYNCPWEVWAYDVQGLDRKVFGPELIWSAAPVIVAAILIFGCFSAMMIMFYAGML